MSQNKASKQGSSKISVVFMGTPKFAAVILSSLINNGNRVIGVYSQPPTTAGRGNKLTKSAVHLCADSYGIDIFAPKNLKDHETSGFLQKLNPDVIVVVAYGLMLPPQILSIPKFGCINVHASLLPKWRGASPIQQAIIAGDKISGITIMKMSSGLDEGDIIMQESIPITPRMTAETLSDELSILGATMIEKFMKNPQKELKNAYPQDSRSATYTKKITKTDGRICWDHSAKDIFNKIRGFYPWPCAWTYLDKTYLKILEAEIIKDPHDLSDNTLPGSIIDKNFTVKCGKGAIRIKTLCPSGGKKMSGIDFLNGHKYTDGFLI